MYTPTNAMVSPKSAAATTAPGDQPWSTVETGAGRGLFFLLACLDGMAVAAMEFRQGRSQGPGGGCEIGSPGFLIGGDGTQQARDANRCRGGVVWRSFSLRLSTSSLRLLLDPSFWMWMGLDGSKKSACDLRGPKTGESFVPAPITAASVGK